MELFSMGTGEILLILLVALLVWGPRRIVEVGRTLGKIMGTLKKVSFDLTTQITRELEEEKPKDSPPKPKANDENKSQAAQTPDTAQPKDTKPVSPEDS